MRLKTLNQKPLSLMWLLLLAVLGVTGILAYVLNKWI